MKNEFEFKKSTDQQTVQALKEILKFTIDKMEYKEPLMKILFNQTSKHLLEKLEKRKPQKKYSLNLSIIEVIILQSILAVIEIEYPYKLETILLKQLLY